MSETLRKELKEILIVEVTSCCGCPVDPKAIDSILTAIRNRVPDKWIVSSLSNGGGIPQLQSDGWNGLRNEILKALK